MHFGFYYLQKCLCVVICTMAQYTVSMCVYCETNTGWWPRVAHFTHIIYSVNFGAGELNSTHSEDEESQALAGIIFLLHLWEWTMAVSLTPTTIMTSVSMCYAHTKLNDTTVAQYIFCSKFYPSISLFVSLHVQHPHKQWFFVKKCDPKCMFSECDFSF